MSHTIVLRKVGGSVMLALPPALLDLVELSAGQAVSVSVDNGKLVIARQHRPRYSLSELLARCEPNAALTEEEREWLDARPTGAELL